MPVSNEQIKYTYITYAAIIGIIAIILLVHCCARQEQEAAAVAEAEFSLLDEAQMVRVMSWQRTNWVERDYQEWKERN